MGTQKMQQQRTVQQRPRKQKNSTVKKLLWVILALQVICAIEFLILIRVLVSWKESVMTVNAGINQEMTGKLPGEADILGVEQDASGGSQSKDNVYNDVKVDESEDWRLVLVNKWNKMEEGYVPELKELADGHMIDARIADALMEMIRGAKKAGHTIYILSAYRSMEKQISLYEAEVAEWLDAGYSEVKAEEKAGTVVAVPGTSEHQLGLAVDLVSSKHVKLDEDAEKTEGYKWLVNNCHKYGFILRYPNGATDITGIIYEPWHFRYVGEDAAEAIMEAGITLEEYLER